MSGRKTKKNYIAPYEFSDVWDEILLGDRELFKEMTEPYVPTLINEARQYIKQERTKGNLPPDTLRAEELVGDALIQAWIRRHGRSPHVSLKVWLSANLRWALHLIVEEERNWHQSKAVSLEEPAILKHAKTENDEWDWVTPQSMTRVCWRDVIADENSISHAA